MQLSQHRVPCVAKRPSNVRPVAPTVAPRWRTAPHPSVAASAVAAEPVVDVKGARTPSTEAPSPAAPQAAVAPAHEAPKAFSWTKQ
ncbi:hypothetical protein MNEG_15515, partial [Monoraphidium neglectum]